MFPVILVAAALLAVDDPKPPPKPTAAERAEYRDTAAKARKDADAHVRLALWCEAHHMPNERDHHLALAVLNNPAHAVARGLMGHVHDGLSWARPERIAQRVKADAELTARLAEYERRRADAPETADGQWALARWCEQNGLKPEAQAHLATVVRLDPRRDVAWKRLGYRKQRDGRWATDADVAAAKAEAEAQKKANRTWAAALERWQKALGAKARRDAAEAALAAVTDPRAVPAILRVFARGGEADQLRAVQLLGQIDSPQASRTLALMAVFAEPAAVRRAAAATLRHRDPREFADALIALLLDPIKFEVKHVNGPDQPGVLFIEGKEANLQRNYRPQGMPTTIMPGDVLGLDPNGNLVARRTLGLFDTGFANWQAYFPPTATMGGNPAAVQALQGAMNQAGVGAAGAHAIGAAKANVGAGVLAPGAVGGLPMLNPFQMMIQASALGVPLLPTTSFDFTMPVQADIPIGQMQAQAQMSALLAEQQLRADKAQLEKVNRAIKDLNDRVAAILKDVSGQDRGAEREKWKAWWVDQLGYAYTPPKPGPDRPTVVQDVQPANQPPPIPVQPYLGAPVAFERMSCFGAGTPVRTRTGPRPIEEIKVGDLVLAQDTTTGALSFRPVLFTHHNPPSKTLKIKLEGDEIVASTFHRFWVAGRGWTMARDLKPGDPVRLLEGPAPVVAIEPGEAQKVYNLDVADAADFFAGRRAALVHDNTLPDPRAVPFDAPKAAAPAPATKPATRTPTK